MAYGDGDPVGSRVERRKGAREKVDRAKAVRALHQAYAAYAAGTTFKPGDLVQTINPVSGFNDLKDDDLAVGIVLEVVPDLKAYLTDDSSAWSGQGVRVGMVSDQGISLVWHEAWQFTAYTGPMPDAH